MSNCCLLITSRKQKREAAANEEDEDAEEEEEQEDSGAEEEDNVNGSEQNSQSQVAPTQVLDGEEFGLDDDDDEKAEEQQRLLREQLLEKMQREQLSNSQHSFLEQDEESRDILQLIGRSKLKASRSSVPTASEFACTHCTTASYSYEINTLFPFKRGQLILFRTNPLATVSPWFVLLT